MSLKECIDQPKNAQSVTEACPSVTKQSADIIMSPLNDSCAYRLDREHFRHGTVAPRFSVVHVPLVSSCSESRYLHTFLSFSPSVPVINFNIFPAELYQVSHGMPIYRFYFFAHPWR